ncbi:hypothetical protein RJ639_033535 [Escallonia herrerae]|uniref:Bromo domain-containing protein n=1 Tax=Escallonia herrerae TaxID=1293975 RepID=A0AA89B9X6_9ASTE|nr:hypothetical protein RJ639_033535 [Escallonia herrerae]
MTNPSLSVSPRIFSSLGLFSSRYQLKNRTLDITTPCFDYLRFFNHSMELRDHKGQLQENMYLKIEGFATDARLTFSNAMLFNQPSNNVYLMARKLSEISHARWKSLEAEISKLYWHVL